MGKITTINPYTGENIAEYETPSKSEVEKKVETARKAQESWKETDVRERSKFVKKLGKKLLAKKKSLSEMITTEMGKPITESAAEIEKSALLCEYFGKMAKKFLRDDEIKTEYQKSYVRFEPLGVIGSIMPWNFPVWQAVRFSVPSIIAGNTIVVKPSSVTVESGGLMLEKMFHACKFPTGVFSVVIGDSAIGTMLIESDVDAVSFTGSVETGAKIAQLAVKNIKKIILELGGSDPFIVLNDANIDAAVEAAVPGRFLNCGQACTSAKRFIVVRQVADQFREKFVESVKQLKTGDPADPGTTLGPMVRESQRTILEDQIRRTLEKGGQLVLGGKAPEGRGYFFQPTVISEVKPDSAMAKEEVFGPAAPIILAENEEEAISIANDSDYGLGASIWTENREKGEQLTRKIKAGMVFVNSGVRSDSRLPFGGVKKSGIGRELSRYGLLETTNIKSIIIK